MSNSRTSRPAVFILTISVSLFATDSFSRAESGKEAAWKIIMSAGTCPLNPYPITEGTS